MQVFNMSLKKNSMWRSRIEVYSKGIKYHIWKDDVRSEV